MKQCACGCIINFPLNAEQCNNCWEVEHRLEEYLKSPKAREKVIAILEPYYLTDGTQAIIDTLKKNFNRLLLINKMNLFKESEKR
jgi:hypothetical protein